ncbi:MAG: hypothetical protein K5639_04250 [Eubacterium sp.]|nr:hypothetical protein [Eubacterium sp.]
MYKYVIPISLVIVVIWLATVVLRLTYWDLSGKVTDISTLEATMAYGYTHPDIWYVVGSLAHIFLFAGLLFFWEEHRRKKASDPEKHGMISSQILYYSRHISKYYALHIVVYFIAYALHGYLGFDGWFCWILALISMVLTEIMVRVYNYLMEICRTGRDKVDSSGKTLKK